MKRLILILILATWWLGTIPLAYQAPATVTAVSTPFEARYLDIDNASVLWAVDYNGTVWSYNTTVSGATWNLELTTSNITYTQYCTLWISPYHNYDVFVAIGMTGIWKHNNTGWHQLTTWASDAIPHLPWHWTENMLTGEIFLQSHSELIYNSSDGNAWTVFYNMTASDSGYYSGTIDDHFHAIHFDNETQTLWASGGDTRDILRRYNSSGNWEIVAIDGPRLGGLGNIYQPTAITSDNTYVYFGADAGTKSFRINKTVATADLTLNITDPEILLDTAVFDDNQWIFEARYFNDTYYMPTCYNDGILLVSYNGFEWVNVWNANGYFLAGEGTPVSDKPTWKGGISSITYRLPVYFICNTVIYSLTLDRAETIHSFNLPFQDDFDNGTLVYERGLSNGTGWLALGEDQYFDTISTNITGASLYECIENRTFEPGENGSWTESGWGTLNITDMDAYTGSYSLQNIVTNGTTEASFVYPPDSEEWNISSSGSGQYFLSCWIKANVTWTEGGTDQPEFYLQIIENDTNTNIATINTVRINITTSWSQQYFGCFVSEATDILRPRIAIYRENETVRAVYIDDVMFWGPLKYSYVDTTRQRFISPAFTNTFNVNETERTTENITMSLGNLGPYYYNVLENGSSIWIGTVTSSYIDTDNIVNYTLSIENSSQLLVYMIVQYEYMISPFDTFATLGIGVFGFVLIGTGCFWGAKEVINPQIDYGTKMIHIGLALVFLILGSGLIIAWLW